MGKQENSLCLETLNPVHRVRGLAPEALRAESPNLAHWHA